MPSGKEYHKKYYQDHKEKRQEYDKEYRSQKITCECGKEVSKHHFARHLRSDSHKKKIDLRGWSDIYIKMPNTKEWLENNKDKIKMYNKKYREENADKIKEKRKDYYENNKDKIKEYRSQNITCECGCEITRHYLTRHLRNDTHKNRMKKSAQVSL